MKEFDIRAVWPEWEIVGMLGKGPFGAVYLIERKDVEKPAYSTVKVITVPPDRSAVDNAAGQGIGLNELKAYFDKFKSDLNWELTMCSSASSPYIAETQKLAVIDTEDWPGWSAYIRMPVLTPLPAYFAKAKAGAEEAVRLGREICSALEVFGRFGLIHGAVHPGNVMVKDGGDFVLSDFGVRRCLKRAGSGLFGNTSNDFEAPEIREGAAFSTAADIYSLGMLMRYALSGGVLPDGELHCSKKVDPRLIDIIRKATAQEPMERYISAAAMLYDLNKIKIKEAKPARMAPAAITALGTVRKNAGTVKVPAEPETKPAEEALDVDEKTTVATETALKEEKETAAEDMKYAAAEEDKPKETTAEAFPPTVEINGIYEVAAAGSKEAENEPIQAAEPHLEAEEKEMAEAADIPAQEEGPLPDSGAPVFSEAEEKKQDEAAQASEFPCITADTEAEETENPSLEMAEQEDIAVADENERLAEEILTEDVIEAVDKAVSKDKKYLRSGNHLKKSREKREKKQLGLYPTVILSCVIVTIVIIASLLVVRPWEKAAPDAGTVPSAAQSVPADTAEQQASGSGELAPVLQSDSEPASEPEPEPTVPVTPDVPLTQEVPEAEISGYILPTDNKLISSSDLEGMTRRETYMVINEIYARHGKIFKTDSIKEYFENQSWYEPVTADSVAIYAKFSEIERENLKTVVNYQKQVGYREW